VGGESGSVRKAEGRRRTLDPVFNVLDVFVGVVEILLHVLGVGV
jgi:hypothetical protein